MSEEELIFSALAELSTRKIAETDEVEGFETNKIPAKKGGRIAKDARTALEEKIGKSVVFCYTTLIWSTLSTAISSNSCWDS